MTRPPRQGLPEISTLPWFTLFVPLICLLVIRATRDLVDDIVSGRGAWRVEGAGWVLRALGVGGAGLCGRSHERPPGAWCGQAESAFLPSSPSPPGWRGGPAGGRAVPLTRSPVSPGATQKRQNHQQQALPDPGGEEVRPRGPAYVWGPSRGKRPPARLAGIGDRPGRSASQRARNLLCSWTSWLSLTAAQPALLKRLLSTKAGTGPVMGVQLKTGAGKI